MTTTPKALQEMGGRGWIVVAWAVFGIGYMIYWFASGGDQEVAKFRNDCVDSRVRALGARWFTELPEQTRFDIIRRCEDALGRYLDSRRR
jgi:hypothetical protein